MLPITEAIGSAPITIADLLNWPVKLYPDKTAINTGSEALTFEELWIHVVGLAKELADLGVRRFQRWVLVADHSIDFFVCLFALAKLGAVAALVHQANAKESFSRFTGSLRLSGIIGPKGMFANGVVSGLDGYVLESCTAFRLYKLEHSLIRGDKQAPIDVDPALLIWSSGSTREARGVILQHAAVLANVRANVRALGLQENDRTLVLLPLAHAYALIHQCLCHLAIGAMVCCPPPPILAPALCRYLEDLSITTLAIAPPLLNILADGLKRGGRQCRELRLVTVGTARVNRDILASAMELLPQATFAITYGLTEAGPRVATLFVRRDEALDPTRVGVPLPNTEIRAIGRGDGTEEIHVRGRSLMRSYADVDWEEGSDCSLKTADWGEIRDGELYIHGRLDRAINRGGNLLAAEAIEDVLRSHPAVLQALVEARPHSFWGEVPVALLSLDPALAQPSHEELRHFCSQRLSAVEVPVSFEVKEGLVGVLKEKQMLVAVQAPRTANAGG